MSGGRRSLKSRAAILLFLPKKLLEPQMDQSALRYLPSHEWVHFDGDTATVGISDFAVNQLSDLTYVELPAIGSQVAYGEQFGEVESVKAASELYSPVSGEVVEVNSGLEEDVTPLSSDPFGTGWLMKVKVSDRSQDAELLDAAGYRAHCEAGEH